MRSLKRYSVVVLVLLSLVAAACAKKTAPVTSPAPPPGAAPPAVTAPPPRPPQRVEESLPVPPQPLSEDSIANRSLDDLNRDSPFKPVFFLLDTAELDDDGNGECGHPQEVPDVGAHH